MPFFYDFCDKEYDVKHPIEILNLDLNNIDSIEFGDFKFEKASDKVCQAYGLNLFDVSKDLNNQGIGYNIDILLELKRN